jgi:hypothetical protein
MAAATATPAGARLTWPDSMKGIAILWIAFFHFFGAYQNGRFPSAITVCAIPLERYVNQLTSRILDKTQESEQPSVKSKQQYGAESWDLGPKIWVLWEEGTSP